jgi:hypothetical protein
MTDQKLVRDDMTTCLYTIITHFDTLTAIVENIKAKMDPERLQWDDSDIITQDRVNQVLVRLLNDELNTMSYAASQLHQIFNEGARAVTSEDEWNQHIRDIVNKGRLSGMEAQDNA